MLSDKKILITGATGLVARPCAERLARENEVWCVARFADTETKAQLEAAGLKTFTWRMGSGSLGDLPRDFTHVLHAAPLRGLDDFDASARENAVAAGMLMDHCRSAEAFVFMSTSAVYAKPPTVDHLVAETDALGGYTPQAPAYPVGKAAAEGAVRAFARVLGLPTTIARLNICYGGTGWGGQPVAMFTRVLAGEPVLTPPDGSEVWCSPIAADDVAGFTDGMWEVAAPDATIVNLAGDDAVTFRQFMSYLAAEAGLPVRFRADPAGIEAFASDNTRRREILGECRIQWKQGMRAAVDARFPGVFDGGAHRYAAVDIQTHVA